MLVSFLFFSSQIWFIDIFFNRNFKINPEDGSEGADEIIYIKKAVHLKGFGRSIKIRKYVFILRFLLSPDFFFVVVLCVTI